MAVSLRALAAVVAVPLIALALTVNLGFYTLPGMLAVLAAAALVVGFCLAGERQVALSPKWAAAALYAPVAGTVAYLLWLTVHETSPLKVQLEAPLAAVGALVLLVAYLGKVRAPKVLPGLLIGVGVLLTGTTALVPQLRFGAPDRPQLLLVTQVGLLGCTILMYLVWLSFLASPRPARGKLFGGGLLTRGWWVRWGLLLAVGGTLRVLAVVGSPDPVIDVHAWLTQAPELLLRGENPYSSTYESPYGTERAARFHISDPPLQHPLAYAPGAVLTGVPAALLGFDVRYVNVAAELLAAVLILLVGLRSGAGEVGLLASGLYLSLPRAAFLIEQAWYEPQLAAAVGLFALWMPRRKKAAAVALGVLLSLKQYVVLLVPALCMICRRRWKVLAGAAAVAALVCLPLVLWDPASFWQYAALGHVKRPVIYFSLILPGLFKNEFGITLPRLAMWALELGLLAALAWRTPRAGNGPFALWLGASMLVFNLYSTQGFPNYYDLALFLILLGVAQGTDRR